MSFSATRSLTDPPGSRNCGQSGQLCGSGRRESTSAFPRISQPVASERHLMRMRGVFPMHSSRPFLMSSASAGVCDSRRRRRPGPRVCAARTAAAPRAAPPRRSVVCEYFSIAVGSVGVRGGVEVEVEPHAAQLPRSIFLHPAAPPPPPPAHPPPPPWTRSSSPRSSARSSASGPVSGRCGPRSMAAGGATGDTSRSRSRRTAARARGSRGAPSCSGTAAPSSSGTRW